MFRRLDWILAFGALLGAAGCSDPVPRPNRVGLHLRIFGGACSQPINKYLPHNNPAEAPSLTVSGEPIADGDDGYNTSCTVAGGGNSFNFSTSIATPALGLDTVSFSLSSPLVNNTGTTAAVAMNVRQTESNYAPDTGTVCTVNVVQVAGVPQIQAGSAWVSFSCPSVRDTSNASGLTCSAEGEIMTADCKD